MTKEKNNGCGMFVAFGFFLQVVIISIVAPSLISKVSKQRMILLGKSIVNASFITLLVTKKFEHCSIAVLCL